MVRKGAVCEVRRGPLSIVVVIFLLYQILLLFYSIIITTVIVLIIARCAAVRYWLLLSFFVLSIFVWILISGTAVIAPIMLTFIFHRS